MNKSGHIAGTTDTPLIEEGRDQAVKAGRQAKELGIDTIATSPLSRAKETAEIIAKEIGYPINQIHVSKLLLERDFGEAEGHPYAPDLNLDGFSDIETVDSLIERAHLSLKWLETLPGETVLIVGHGSYGRALRSILIKEKPFSYREKIQNSEILLWYAAN